MLLAVVVPLLLTPYGAAAQTKFSIQDLPWHALLRYPGNIPKSAQLVFRDQGLHALAVCPSKQFGIGYTVTPHDPQNSLQTSYTEVLQQP